MEDYIYYGLGLIVLYVLYIRYRTRSKKFSYDDVLESEKYKVKGKYES